MLPTPMVFGFSLYSRGETPGMGNRVFGSSTIQRVREGSAVVL